MHARPPRAAALGSRGFRRHGSLSGLRVVVRGWSRSVGPAGRADPSGGAVGVALRSPWSVVLGAVMTPAEQVNVVRIGGSTRRPGSSVVEIAAPRRHGTAGERADLVASHDEVREFCRWPVDPPAIFE